MTRVDDEIRVALKPGQTITVTTVPEVPLSERERQARIRAMDSSRGYFQHNAEAIGHLLGGRTEDRERLQMDSGEELRAVALELISANVSVDDVITDTQRTLLANVGRNDPERLYDVAQVYGAVLKGEITAIAAEREQAMVVKRGSAS